MSNYRERWQRLQARGYRVRYDPLLTLLSRQYFEHVAKVEGIPPEAFRWPWYARNVDLHRYNVLTTEGGEPIRRWQPIVARWLQWWLYVDSHLVESAMGLCRPWVIVGFRPGMAEVRPQYRKYAYTRFIGTRPFGLAVEAKDSPAWREITAELVSIEGVYHMDFMLAELSPGLRERFGLELKRDRRGKPYIEAGVHMWVGVGTKRGPYWKPSIRRYSLEDFWVEKSFMRGFDFLRSQLEIRFPKASPALRELDPLLPYRWRLYTPEEALLIAKKWDELRRRIPEWGKRFPISQAGSIVGGEPEPSMMAWWTADYVTHAICTTDTPIDRWPTLLEEIMGEAWESFTAKRAEYEAQLKSEWPKPGIPERGIPYIGAKMPQYLLVAHYQPLHAYRALIPVIHGMCQYGQLGRPDPTLDELRERGWEYAKEMVAQAMAELPKPEELPQPEELQVPMPPIITPEAVLETVGEREEAPTQAPAFALPIKSGFIWLGLGGALLLALWLGLKGRGR